MVIPSMSRSNGNASSVAVISTVLGAMVTPSMSSIIWSASAVFASTVISTTVSLGNFTPVMVLSVRCASSSCALIFCRLSSSAAARHAFCSSCTFLVCASMLPSRAGGSFLVPLPEPPPFPMSLLTVKPSARFIVRKACVCVLYI